VRLFFYNGCIEVINMKLVFVYGSLRKTGSLHQYASFDMNAEFVKDAELNGATMYSTGAYSCIVLDGSQNTVKGEIYRFKDEATYRQIRDMEIESGYYEETIIIDGMEVVAYVYTQPPFLSKKVTSGNWIHHKMTEVYKCNVC
jgi:gamma-glutamylcyclotransferase (GGCT)/AIG2-like uncharacterized protein YtfP